MPRKPLISVPQMPMRCTRTSASPAAGRWGSSRFVSAKVPGFSRRMAFMVLALYPFFAPPQGSTYDLSFAVIMRCFTRRRTSRMSPFAESPVPEFMAFLMFAFGASIGSFLNVVAYRVPLGKSIIRPASRCPHCETPLRSFDNVPVLGWLWLRGKCRACRGPISPRYPMVEILLGAVCSVLAWVDWPMGGVILPGADLDQMQRYGVFAYHELLIVG